MRGLGVLLALAAHVAGAADPRPPAGLPAATVVRVVDGDTVVVLLGRHEEVVRLIGVDTPEVHESPKLEREAERRGQDRALIQALGVRATGFTQAHLLARSVSVEGDVEAYDRYGRRLAYLWLPDGTLFNAELLRAGYARVLTIPPNVKYAEHFLALERRARTDGRGLWREGMGAGSTGPVR
jgi:micrococcal nuclease